MPIKCICKLLKLGALSEEFSLITIGTSSQPCKRRKEWPLQFRSFERMFMIDKKSNEGLTSRPRTFMRGFGSLGILMLAASLADAGQRVSETSLAAYTSALPSDGSSYVIMMLTLCSLSPVMPLNTNPWPAGQENCGA